MKFSRFCYYTAIVPGTPEEQVFLSRILNTNGKDFVGEIFYYKFQNISQYIHIYNAPSVWNDVGVKEKYSGASANRLIYFTTPIYEKKSIKKNTLMYDILVKDKYLAISVETTESLDFLKFELQFAVLPTKIMISLFDRISINYTRK